MLRELIFTGYIVVVLSACTFGVPIGERGTGSEITHIPQTSKSKSGNPSSSIVQAYLSSAASPPGTAKNSMVAKHPVVKYIICME